MAFFQSPPSLENTYTEDDVLRRYLRYSLPPDVMKQVEPELLELGALAAELSPALSEERDDLPRLVQWDAWGRRVDRIELSRLWARSAKIAAEKGVVATAYERRSGAYSRIHQFALAFLIEPSWGVYSCPLAMTDGAAKTLIASKNEALVARAVPRLVSRDPAAAWTSGQWMTERTGGSDVAISETVAKAEGDRFRLYGTKWFTSATTSQMALTLARPEGNPPGGSGLALFYVETRDGEGQLNGISINRLKDKLGTRMVPTAELTLDGALAIPVKGTSDGIRNITPMLSVTRTWNALCSTSGMRRAVMLAKDYARRRVAFGSPLSVKPLHVDTLAGIEAESEGAFLLAFRGVELLGKEEAGELTEGEAALLRLLTPIIKLTTGKQAVAIASESLEAFGGAGYIEDTGLPRLLRDAQVLSIWEGTTNVLSLDLFRALKGRSLAPIEAEIVACTKDVEPSLGSAAEAARRAFSHAEQWFAKALARGEAPLEAGARRFAMTLGRALEVAYLVKLAKAGRGDREDAKPAAAARRMVLHGVDLIVDDETVNDSAILAG